jgi:PDZ domain
MAGFFQRLPEELLSVGLDRENRDMRWNAILIIVVLLTVAEATTAQESPPVSAMLPRNSEGLVKSLTDLDHPEYLVREAATRRLVSFGSAAVPPLMELAKTGHAESAVRAFDVLQKLYREGDDETYEAVESAYESLADCDNVSAESRANAAIDAGADVRQAKAVSSFQKLGGVLRFRKLDPQTDNEPDDPESSRPVEYAMLDKTWKGGDEGLKFLRRIEEFRMQSDVRGPSLFLIKGTPVSEEAIAALEASLPNLAIQRRGPACLGVSPLVRFGGPGEIGLQVAIVKPGSAADRAGLKPGDFLLKFNGFETPDFETLVDKISEKQPGDKVPVVYNRDGVEDTCIVELRGWD